MPRGAPASGASQGGAGPSPIPQLGSGVLGPGGQLGVGTPPVWDQAAAQCFWGEAAAPHVAEKGLGGGLEGPGMLGVGWVGSRGCCGVGCSVLPEQPLHPLPCPPLTFHEHSEDVSEDSEGGAKDEDREEEGTDGVCDLALGLQRAGAA